MADSDFEESEDFDTHNTGMINASELINAIINSKLSIP